jgi:hypothetical protein
MRYSLRTLRLLVVAVCTALSLVRLEFVTGSLILISIFVAGWYLLPPRHWRAAAYGAVGGMLLGFIALQVHLAGQATRPANGMPVSGEVIEAVETWRPWILHGGSLVGGWLGLCCLHAADSPSPTAPPREQPGLKA